MVAIETVLIIVLLTYLHLFKIFIFIDIKLIPPIKKVELSCFRQGIQTVDQRQVKGTYVRTGIVKWWQCIDGLFPDRTEW